MNRWGKCGSELEGMTLKGPLKVEVPLILHMQVISDPLK